jgi:hypothetical protein
MIIDLMPFTKKNKHIVTKVTNIVKFKLLNNYKSRAEAALAVQTIDSIAIS